MGKLMSEIAIETKNFLERTTTDNANTPDDDEIHVMSETDCPQIFPFLTTSQCDVFIHKG